MDLNIARLLGSKSRVLPVLFFAACSLTPPKDVVVREDVTAALEQAALGHKPVLLVYGASWCNACRALMEGLQHRQVARALAGVQVVYVQLGQDLRPVQPLPAQWQPEAHDLQAVPTLMYIDARTPGRPCATLQGYVGPKRLTEWLAQAPCRS